MRRTAVTTGARYLGIGRGPKTRDGCSVELYLRLPYGGEVELIERFIPKAGSVMELGCGVGRVTRELLTRGFRVTAVDNSPEMLACVPPGATKLCADIESLAVDERFDAVILASCLVNTPDDALRSAQLARCREHLGPGGHLLLERFDPSWLANVQAGPLDSIGTVEMRVDAVRGHGAERELCLRYREGGDEWLQYFTAAILDDEDVRRCLSSAGFGPPHWINRRWASAQVANRAGGQRVRAGTARPGARGSTIAIPIAGPSAVLIRPIEEHDFEAWLPLWNGYNAFYGRKEDTALAPEITGTTWRRFLDPDEPVFALVAESEGGLSGLAHYLFHRSTTRLELTCYLQDLFTAQGERGRGVGRALIEGVYEAARAAGSKRVYWQTQETNVAGRTLYDKVATHAGFIVYSHDV